MRSSRVVRVSDSQCRSRNCPIILRHSGILEAADETVLNIVHKKKKIPKIPLFLYGSLRQGERTMEKAPLGNNLRPRQPLRNRALRTNIALPAQKVAIFYERVVYNWFFLNCFIF